MTAGSDDAPATRQQLAGEFETQAAIGAGHQAVAGFHAGSMPRCKRFRRRYRFCTGPMA
jgi:hypothetical protein